MKSEVPFTISAPDIAPTGYFYNGYCMQSTATYVYLAALAVVADSRDVPDNEVPPAVTLKYGACYTADYASPGDPITAELRLLDGRGVLGGIDARDPSPEDCRDAARRADIPNVITLEQIRTDSVLHKDRGICAETADGTVVFLWINQAHEIPGTQGLRTYSMIATQWKPATQGTQPPG
ncbi:hypothetical protein LO772_15095 [Yinghuangia sp. ASG 101]|uniref:hypothetical protein n=1 Tax=Yinghuangia sp. ASG 101 TaxID=2896848 RepID=UPI001E5077E5|nr:hypothetical protein [Yinghuangia sp. ASG 101]UGQ14777.1 hypothetical protein LO772_15095 [Yinghuangia sp. ASG 101]